MGLSDSKMSSSPSAIFTAVLLLFSSLFIVTGCSLSPSNDLDGTERLRNLVLENQTLWDSTGIEDYRITYDRVVGEDVDQDILVIVRGGAVDSVSQSGQPVQDESKVLTIDDVFEEMLTVLDRSDRGSFDVAFDRELSYPVRYQVQAGDNTPRMAVYVSGFRDDTPE